MNEVLRTAVATNSTSMDGNHPASSLFVAEEGMLYHGNNSSSSNHNRLTEGENFSTDNPSLLLDLGDSSQLLTTANTDDVRDEGGSENVIVPPPRPLPVGWVVKASHSQPGYFYYFHQETGICTWQPPVLPEGRWSDVPSTSLTPTNGKEEEEDPIRNNKRPSTHPQEGTAGQRKNSATGDSGQIDPLAEAGPPAKRSKPSPAQAMEDASQAAPPSTGPLPSATTTTTTTTTTSSNYVNSLTTTPTNKPRPSKVRVLHILRKHKDSRRPSSWRNPHITMTKEQAREELQGLLEGVLQEVEHEPEELRATFEELARTESDCSSAKRGGDLGFFGPKKMQPTFEEAAFALDVGQMSGLVESSSGVHILLRIG